MRLNFELKFMDLPYAGLRPRPPPAPFIFPPHFLNSVGSRLETGTPLEKTHGPPRTFLPGQVSFFSQMNYEKMKKRLSGPKKSR
jgi:hypothetical protein